MNTKPRKRKCAHCRELFQPWNTLQRACSPVCALKLAAEKEEKRFRQWRRKRRGHCNRYKGGGNQLGYIEGIRRRYGEQHVELLQSLKRMADQGQLPPLTKDEVRDIGAEYRRKCRELEAA